MRTLFDSSSGAAAIVHATPQAASESPGSGAAAIVHATPQAASESPGSGAAAIVHATPQAASESPFFLCCLGNLFVL